MKEKLERWMEPDSIMDKFGVVVVTSETVVGHIMKEKTARFAKAMFHFLKARAYHNCNVEVTGKAVNYGHLKEMKVPCIIKFIGESPFIDVITNELQKHK